MRHDVAIRFSWCAVGGRIAIPQGHFLRARRRPYTPPRNDVGDGYIVRSTERSTARHTEYPALSKPSADILPALVLFLNNMPQKILLLRLSIFRNSPIRYSAWFTSSGVAVSSQIFLSR